MKRNQPTGSSNNQHRKRIEKIFLYVVIPLVSYVIALFLWNTILTFINKKVFEIDVELFKSREVYIYALVSAGIIFIVSLGISIWYDMFASSRILNKAEDATSKIYGDARWLTRKEIQKKYGYYNFNTLSNENVSGYVVASDIVNNTLRLSVVQEVHALMVGVSGDGKSLRYIGPSIQMNAASATKASMIINDAKGELFSQHSKALQDAGYDVKLINLRLPRESVRFNPLSLIWDLWMGSEEKERNSSLTPSELDSLYEAYRQKFTQEEAAQLAVASSHKAKKPTPQLDNTAKKLLSKDEYYKEWQLSELKQARDMKDRAQVLIQEMSQILVPEGSGENKVWSDGAQGICAGIIHAMLEDGLNEELNFTRDMFTVSQISNIVNRQQGELNDFLRLRPSSSSVFDFAGMIIDNQSEKTVSSYLATLSTSLKSYLEGGLEYIMSDTDIDFSTLVTKPTAIFILVPDEYLTRHTVASMAISQLYNELIFQSSQYPNNKLPRPVYFMLDEFGNLPKLPGLPTWITISKSRRIYFNLLIQSLSQVEEKYNQHNAKTIIQNCHLQMIMGSNDAENVKHFQEKFGTRTIINRTANFDKKTTTIEYQGSSSLGKVELISADMLQKITPGTVYWKMLRENPAQTHLEIIFDLENFIELGSVNKAQPYISFNPRERFYSLSDRNNYIKEKKKKKPAPTNGGEPQTNLSSNEEDYTEIFNDEAIDKELNRMDDDIHQKLFNA